jgi:CheY-like chemotaxis protein
MAKILVAEDDRFLATAYRAKLTKMGFEVTVATDGEEALAALPQILPDLILLDLVMPRKDGFATLEAIKKQDQFKNIPVIVASNLGQKEDLDKAKALGAADYVIKSDLSMDSLIEKINSVLQSGKAT